MKGCFLILIVFSFSNFISAQNTAKYPTENACAQFDNTKRSIVFTKGEKRCDTLYTSTAYMTVFKGICSNNNYQIVKYALGFLYKNGFYERHLKTWADMDEPGLKVFLKVDKFLIDDIIAINTSGDTLRLPGIVCFVK